MQPGDIVLFTGGKRAYAGGIVAYRTRNATLARELWGVDKKGRTWEFVYFLKDIFDLSIPYAALNDTLGYKKNYVHQGIMVVDPTRSQKLIDTFHLDNRLALESEVEEARSIVAESAGKPSVRQGFRLSPTERKAIEDHAVKMAVEYCSKQGWKVTDVSRKQSYDLYCSRGEAELRVEVKGTTSDGREVLLTPNEVSHARGAFPHIMLLVVSQIRLSPKSVPEGGMITVFHPWAIDKGQLAPVGYAYSVPPDGV
jgi:hypothetical protein